MIITDIAKIFLLFILSIATSYHEIEPSPLSRLLGNEKRNGHFRHFYE